MHIDCYYLAVKDKVNHPCIIHYNLGQTEEGVYLKEKAGKNGLVMVIRLTGESKKRYEDVAISDDTAYIAEIDTLEIKDNQVAVRIADIKSIEFKD